MKSTRSTTIERCATVDRDPGANRERDRDSRGTLKSTVSRKSTNFAMINGSRQPPRPAPSMVHYSDEDSAKGYDENPDDSDSLTEKPSEISSTDSQVNFEEKSLFTYFFTSFSIFRVPSQSMTVATPAIRTLSSTTMPMSTRPSVSPGRSTARPWPFQSLPEGQPLQGPRPHKMVLWVGGQYRPVRADPDRWLRLVLTPSQPTNWPRLILEVTPHSRSPIRTDPRP
jgi:hypothetical protein